MIYNNINVCKAFSFLSSQIHFFFNKQLDFGPALKSCLTCLVFQPRRMTGTPQNLLFLAVFWLLNVIHKFARMYSSYKESHFTKSFD